MPNDDTLKPKQEYIQERTITITIYIYSDHYCSNSVNVRQNKKRIEVLKKH